MGLKDMLFGKKEDANKVAYRDEVKKAVSDGKLTADKMARLEKLKQELDVTAASQDFTMVRREQYQTAADAMMKGGPRAATAPPARRAERRPSSFQVRQDRGCLFRKSSSWHRVHAG